MNDVEELVAFVLAQTKGPVDRWAVAATLESRGLRDIDAVERYGRRDIFDLADEVYARCRERLGEVEPVVTDDPTVSLPARLRRFFRFYGQGAFFAIPMVVQVASITILGFGLWADVDFTVAQATAVSVATLGSLVVTGGFVQSIGRLGLFYREQESHLLAERVLRRLIVVGAVVSGGVGVAAYAVNLATAWLPAGLAAVALVYYLLLAGFWLVLAVLYAMQRRLAIVIATTAGIAVIGVLDALTPIGIYAAQWLGLVAAIAVAYAWVHRLLRRAAATVSGDVRLARLPRAPILAHAAAPYFAYGILYYLFLFADRILGWSADEEQPFLITFRTPYELGLDWALLALILTIAMLEYTINEFSATIIPVQERFSAGEVRAHNAHFGRFYATQLSLLAALSVVSALLVYFGVFALDRVGGLGDLDVFLDDPVTRTVFAWGVVGYSLLVWALMNGVLFFSLSRPAYALRPIVASLAVGVAVGLVASRTGPYWASVVGLTAGSAVFAALTTRRAVRVLRRLDYYYYSAY